MAVLIGIALGVALLYFWLIGHWFARVIVLLGLVVALGAGGAVLMNDGGKNAGGGVLGFMIGGALAWFISGAPIYYWRYRLTGSLTALTPC